MLVYNHLVPKGKRLILSDISKDVVLFSLDITMLPMAAYQNVDDISDSFNLDRGQITLLRLLGTGNFGQVSKAIYGALHSEVAVKSLKGSYTLCFFSS